MNTTVTVTKRGVEGTQLSVNGPRRKAVAQVAYTWVDAGTEEGRALIGGEGAGGGRVSKRLGIEEEGGGSRRRRAESTTSWAKEATKAGEPIGVPRTRWPSRRAEVPSPRSMWEGTLSKI